MSFTFPGKIPVFWDVILCRMFGVTNRGVLHPYRCSGTPQVTAILDCTWTSKETGISPSREQSSRCFYPRVTVAYCDIRRIYGIPRANDKPFCTLIYLNEVELTLYSPVVTICTASLTFNNSTFCPHTVFMCFMWI